MIKRLLLLSAFQLSAFPLFAAGPISPPSDRITGPSGATVSVADGNASITAGAGGAVNVTNGDVYVPTLIDFSTVVSPIVSASGHASLAYDGTNLLLSKNGGAYGAFGALPLSGTGATVTTSQPLLDLSQTWNAGGVTFTGIKLNITDSASASASLLLDLQVGGTTRTSITKPGLLTTPNGFFGSGANAVGVGYNGNGQVTIGGTGYLGLGASTTSPDVIAIRDAANTLAQRNGANDQAFRVYGLYTDTSNYHYGSLAMSDTALTISTQTAGTGVDNLNIVLAPSGTGGVSAGSDLTFSDVSEGPVVKSPDGNRWRLQVDNAGTISAVDLDP